MENSSYFNPSEDGKTLPATMLEPGCTKEAEVEYSIFRNPIDNQPRRVKLPLPEFIAKMLEHPIKASKFGPAFSPAVYPVDAKRGDAHVVAVTMLVLDIDDGTPYETIKAKLLGIKHLVYSTFRHSDQLHKYRIIVFLDQSVPASEWPSFWLRAEAYFDGHLDPSTKDLSRMYFMPSHAQNAQYFSDFHDGRPLMSTDLPELSAVRTVAKPAKNSEVKGAPKQREDLGIEEVYEPHPIEAVPVMVEHCAFMRYASSPETQPKVTEPLWRAMISNASMAPGADAWIHVASEHHPDYDEAETERKIIACRNHGAPLTCDTIRASGFDGCPDGGCLSVRGMPVKAPAALMHWHGKNSQSAVDRLTVESYQVKDFTVTNEGVLHTKWAKDSDGKEYPKLTWVSRTRIDVKCQIRDAASGNWSLVLAITDPDGQQKEYTLPLADLHMPIKSYRQEIACLGGLLCTGGIASELFAQYLLEASIGIARATLVTQIGWQPNGVFALPGKVYGDAAQSQYHFRLNNKRQASGFETLGSIDGWNEVMALLRGNSRLQLFVITALAGPVLELFQVENFGFNLVGPSSIGKSTALRAAESVWRQCQVLLNWNGTSNGIQALAVLHNNTVMTLDEMGMSESQALFTLMYFLANGRERARAQQSGEHRDTKTFSLTYLSTSERSAGQLLAAGGKEGAAGQAIRMLEIPADVQFGIFEQLNDLPSPVDLANRINAGVKANAGHVGRAWVSLLADPERQQQILQRIRECQELFIADCKHLDDAGQTLRALEKFALIAGVGAVCCEEGILPWGVQDVNQGVKRCFEAWVGQRSSRGELESVQAIDAANRFIMLHGASRFEQREVVGIEGDRRPIINRAGYVETTSDGPVYYVNSEVYKKDLCGSLDPKMVTKSLREAGFLIEGTNAAQHRLREQGQRVSFYAIKGSVTGDYRSSGPVREVVQQTTVETNYQV